MQIRFQTAGNLDLTNLRYIIAFNTSGTGSEPYARYDNPENNFRDLTFAIVVGGNGVGAQARIIQYYRQPAPGGGTQVVQLPVTGIDQSRLFLNTDNPQQFTVTFDRSIFYAQQTAPSPSGSASPSPTPSPSPAASSSASPSPTPSPNTPATIAPQQTWFINFITTDANGFPLDAAGQGGSQDTSFVFNVDTTTTFDKQYFFATGYVAASSQSAQIQNTEVTNNP